ncbi:hypothetical protein BX616_010020 [Lobosporangium transversale]|nr:hypothetical protein BX616_010020 [Lobosporangium transversale]
MFGPLSIFTLNITLAVLQFLLFAAVGAILAIYSRFGDQYANSIRWTRQGGYVEMISSLYDSFHIVPSRTKCIMVITILASLVAGLFDKGYLSNHPEFIIYNPEIAFSGWSTSIRYGENITEAMSLLINSTRNIPTADASSGRLYIPRLTEYEIVCAQSNVQFLDHDVALPTQGGCSNTYIGFTTTSVISYHTTIVLQRFPNRWSMVIPGGEELHDASLSINFENRGILCVLGEINIPSFAISNKAKVNRLPRTITTKCVHEDGDVSVVAATTVHFSEGFQSRLNNTTTRFFQEDDEIFQAMDELIKRTVPSDTDMDRPTMLAKVRIRGTMLDTVICVFSIVVGLQYPVCQYSVINSLVVRPKEQSVDIKKARGNESLPIYPLKKLNAMMIEHVPPIIHGERSLVSNSQLQDDTVAASRLMALLGQNFHNDFESEESEKLYVIYDVFYPEKGLEIPKWLLIVILVLMVVCFCLWTLAEGLLDRKYTSSLYKTISIQLSPYNQASAPWIMRVDVEPMKFEDIPIVSIQEEMGKNTEPKDTNALLMDSPLEV